MISSVFFDIDDTLFPSTEFSEFARRNAIRALIAMGLPYSESKITRILNDIVAKKGSNYPRHFDEVLKRLGVKNRNRYVAAAVAAYHDTKASISPYPEVPRILVALKSAGKRIYVASDGIEVKQWDKLIRMKIALFFDDVFVSENLKIKKGENFYKEILRKLRAKPNECLMVGDREDKDIVPAKKAGMLTFRVFRGKYSTKHKSTVADYYGDDLTRLVDIVKK
ncbi:MAG: TIGR02253 family HAD-type hydrolase [Candidatus Bilamarchaeaceae archaeon]